MSAEDLFNDVAYFCFALIAIYAVVVACFDDAACDLASSVCSHLASPRYGSIADASIPSLLADRVRGAVAWLRGAGQDSEEQQEEEEEEEDGLVARAERRALRTARTRVENARMSTHVNELVKERARLDEDHARLDGFVNELVKGRRARREAPKCQPLPEPTVDDLLGIAASWNSKVRTCAHEPGANSPATIGHVMAESP
mmetsp:Transcript_33365/g.85254  ORF Transcript_33365/g.85254 Transcript_33365/m.85254 type:complete len:200 (-) Transcript_33365:9-608(-)